MTAFGVIRCLARAGIKVPEDCSVIGFDDVIPAGLSVPSLTTVRQPMEALGSAAVAIILDAVNAAIEERESQPCTAPRPRTSGTRIHPRCLLGLELCVAASVLG